MKNHDSVFLVERILKQATSLSLFIKYYGCDNLENKFKIKKTKLQLIEKINALITTSDMNEKKFLENIAVKMKGEIDCYQILTVIKELKKILIKIATKE